MSAGNEKLTVRQQEVRDAGRRRVDKLMASGEYSLAPLQPGEPARDNEITRLAKDLLEAEARL